MAYIDYEYYKTLFGEKAIPEADFNRLVWDSCKKIDNATTGVDNVKKLKIAFPTDEDDAEAVKDVSANFCQSHTRLSRQKQESKHHKATSR